MRANGRRNGGCGFFFISEKRERGNFEEAKKACGFVKGGIIIIIMREREREER